MSSVLTVTEADFAREVLESPVPVLVDFWATWCTSCVAFFPKLEEIATVMAGRARVVTVNVEEHPDVAARYGVRGLPTILVFVGGTPRKALLGNQRKETVLEALAGFAPKSA